MDLRIDSRQKDQANSRNDINRFKKNNFNMKFI